MEEDRNEQLKASLADLNQYRASRRGRSRQASATESSRNWTPLLVTGAALLGVLLGLGAAGLSKALGSGSRNQV